MNPKKENKKGGSDNFSFMRNTYLELRNPVKNFKIHGQKSGMWEYFDENLKLTTDMTKARFQKWRKHIEWDK